jgi:hypothetical protein
MISYYVRLFSEVCYTFNTNSANQSAYLLIEGDKGSKYKLEKILWQLNMVSIFHNCFCLSVLTLSAIFSEIAEQKGPKNVLGHLFKKALLQFF